MEWLVAIINRKLAPFVWLCRCWVCARLAGAAAERFALRCWASFVGAGTIGPIEEGGLCAVGDASLEAVGFAVAPRAPASPASALPVAGPP